MSNGDARQVTENKTKIEGIEKDITTILDWVRRVEDKIDKALQAAMRRPGWPVCLVITILTSAAVGLLVALLNHLSHGA